MEINQITEKIIGCVYTVSNTLGVGFLEKVYENALIHEIKKAGLEIKHQYPIKVIYDNVVVGDYKTDILVEDSVLVELKVVKSFDDAHMAQVMNYLKATGLKICLMINLGKSKIQIKRVVNKL